MNGTVGELTKGAHSFVTPIGVVCVLRLDFALFFIVLQ
jgi:hypothetical protein